MVPKFSGVSAAGYSRLLTPYPGKGLLEGRIKKAELRNR